MGLAARRIRPKARLKAELTIRHLVKDAEPGLWYYIPLVCDRIRAFCKRYDTDSDPEDLCEQLQRHFTAPISYVTCMVALQDLRLVGHLLVRIEVWGKKTVANILQFEVDAGVSIPRGALVRALDEMEGWASRSGAQEMHLDAINPRVERAFRTFYGFEWYRTRMRKEI